MLAYNEIYKIAGDISRKGLYINKIAIKELTKTTTDCAHCKAACCKLEVMLISDTGVPEAFIQRDKWGAETLKREDDGWCSALDRQTMLCTIYQNRPWICREFEMGSVECKDEFTARN